MSLVTSTTEDRFLMMGLDIETTDKDHLGEIIQIGIYIDPEHQYVSDVGHRGKFVVKEEALAVNGFTMERIYNGPPVFVVEVELRKFMNQVKRDFPWVEADRVMPVGFNVGSFDISYISRTFPIFKSEFGYRSADLNAILSFLYPTPTHYDEQKQIAKSVCTKQVLAANQAHDALWDAEHAIHIYNYLRSCIS